MSHPETRSLPLPAFDRPVKVLIVAAPWYQEIAFLLVQGAKAVLARINAEVEVLEVPGPLQVPPAIATAERLAEFDGYVALGCLIRGETSRCDTESAEISRALMGLSMAGAAVGNGILAVENFSQGVERADPAGADKGGEAAAAALHLIAISRKWAGQTKGIGFRA